MFVQHPLFLRQKITDGVRIAKPDEGGFKGGCSKLEVRGRLPP
jgi:hypothetical protein